MCRYTIQNLVHNIEFLIDGAKWGNFEVNFPNQISFSPPPAHTQSTEVTWQIRVCISPLSIFLILHFTFCFKNSWDLIFTQRCAKTSRFPAGDFDPMMSTWQNSRIHYNGILKLCVGWCTMNQTIPILRLNFSLRAEAKTSELFRVLCPSDSHLNCGGPWTPLGSLVFLFSTKRNNRIHYNFESLLWKLKHVHLTWDLIFHPEMC